MESEIASLEPSILREYEKELGQSKKRQRPPDEIVKFYRLRRSKQAELNRTHKSQCWKWCESLSDETYANLYKYTKGRIEKFCN